MSVGGKLKQMLTLSTKYRTEQQNNTNRHTLFITALLNHFHIAILSNILNFLSPFSSFEPGCMLNPLATEFSFKF
jgi:hypothetical protein